MPPPPPGDASEAPAEGQGETPAEPAAPAAPGEPEWVGRAIESYQVGDPGRASLEVVAQLSGDPSDPPDTMLDGSRVGRLELRAASVRGLSHRQVGTPRQDDYGIAVSHEGWLVLAVADGVSAGHLSHRAARLACRTATTELRRALDGGTGPGDVDWARVFDACARQILAHGRKVVPPAEGADAPEPREIADAMASTLILAVVHLEPDASGTHWAQVVPFGDTSAMVLLDGERWNPVTGVKNAGAVVATSGTRALPQVPTPPLEVQQTGIRAGDALVLMTDGVGDPLGNGEGDVGRFLADVWRTPPDPVSFAAQVGFARRSFDDDRTAVAVWPVA
jgi:serine/threonine protein phosphatase PrpC